MEPSELVVASRRFEAARQISELHAAGARGGLHGHGFIASVYACIPKGWATFDGSEGHDLQERLTRCVEPLDYSLLNRRIETPTDENVAAWIDKHIDVPGLSRIAIQSTPHQGTFIAPNAELAHVWRRYTFHAAHQLPYVPIGHKCGRLHGHGFAVVIHAARHLSAQSFGYEALDRLWAPMNSALNYCCLNDIAGLQNPTSEMLSSWLWAQLKPSCPALTAITVFETDSCGATYDGSEYQIWKDFTIDSAVRMGGAPTSDPRHKIHGHTYTLRLKLTAPLDIVMGWTVDFGDVKSIFEPVFKSLDHHPLHDQPDLVKGDPVSIARWIQQRVLVDLPQLDSIELYETEGCGAIVGRSKSEPGLPL